MEAGFMLENDAMKYSKVYVVLMKIILP